MHLNLLYQVWLILKRDAATRKPQGFCIKNTKILGFKTIESCDAVIYAL